MLRNVRFSAYRLFHRSVVFNILFTQLFILYRQQHLAITGLLVHPCTLLSLRHVMEQEIEMSAARGGDVRPLFDRQSPVL